MTQFWRSLTLICAAVYRLQNVITINKIVKLWRLNSFVSGLREMLAVTPCCTVFVWLLILSLLMSYIYIYITYRSANLQNLHLNIYSTNTLTEYFKHAAHSLFFFSSKCRLFHNATFFG